MKELDDAEASHRAAVKVFAEVIETSAENVVEVDRQEASQFREHVLRLAGRVSASAAASDLETGRKLFRAELRDYSKKAGQQVQLLREELDAAGTAMRSFVEGVSSSSGEHETVLRREFEQLEQAAEADDVRTVRASVHATVRAVSESFENLKRANALNIAQLRDEIRVLQGELERGKSKGEARQEAIPKRALDTEIEELLRLDRAFVAVLMGLPDHDTLYERFRKERVDAALKGLLTNATALVRQQAPQASMSEWNTALYGVVMPVGALTTNWQKQLAVSHVFQVDGIPRTLRIDPRVEAVERAVGESHTLFFSRLSQATERVRKAG
jgi:hypothetical protein